MKIFIPIIVASLFFCIGVEFQYRVERRIFSIGSMFEPQLFAAVVGALIGILPAYFLVLLNESSKEKKNYQSWLSGLSAELTHIQKCITEIKGYIEEGRASTKRMNSDFLETARLAIFSFENDTDFLESLTNAYRDIVHTNDMLERFEKMTSSRSDFQPNVLASMNGVNNSVRALQNHVANKVQK